ncbi:MAG: hypothetical protein HN350_06685 [Phycisphaerales bacterium]|jgi:hypothetical protein|nr:hypothetical protein [Phycisphaerales bacterium]
MNLLAYILAESEYSFIEVIVIALFFGISIIGAIIKKAQEKQAGAKNKQQTPKTQVRQPAQKQQQQTPRYQPIPPANVRKPQPQAKNAKTVRVAEELRAQQQRQVQQQRAQQQRMATRKPPESDRAAVEARVVNPKLAQDDLGLSLIEQITPAVSLVTTADARQAMIMHEIFLPPKALRQDNEMWDE